MMKKHFYFGMNINKIKKNIKISGPKIIFENWQNSLKL